MLSIGMGGFRTNCIGLFLVVIMMSRELLAFVVGPKKLPILQLVGQSPVCACTCTLTPTHICSAEGLVKVKNLFMIT